MGTSHKMGEKTNSDLTQDDQQIGSNSGSSRGRRGEIAPGSSTSLESTKNIIGLHL